ncbi:MAG: SUMF1/EgtB/PvdO family nonheme iron enzyme [Spirochaetia bacterium]|nr:SUMF1/EgtB/PvdO family nonheme iron enzyme [Spirochaetia bacterium]
MKKYILILLLLSQYIFAEDLKLEMLPIPGQKFSMLSTEVPQHMYESIIGENPSVIKGDFFPVENISWYDAVYFCNVLSIKMGLDPVYYVNNVNDPKKWHYKPHKGNKINGKVEWDKSKNGFRLPTIDEWEYTASNGYDGKYSLDEICWYKNNSDNKTHPVGQKQPNIYGLYDIVGNVWEWCWDSYILNPNMHFYRGGAYDSQEDDCRTTEYYHENGRYTDKTLGFRILCKNKK